LEGDVEPAVKLRLSTIEAALFTIAIGGSQYISILHWFGRPAASVSLFKAVDLVVARLDRQRRHY
jgi:hypothetical protein